MKYFIDRDTQEIISFDDSILFNADDTGIIVFTQADGTPISTPSTLTAYYGLLPYQKSRAEEYPPIADYLDGIVKGDANQIQIYIDACKAVKEKYPKNS